jgi:hypothetical protein
VNVGGGSEVGATSEPVVGSGIDATGVADGASLEVAAFDELSAVADASDFFAATGAEYSIFSQQPASRKIGATLSHVRI